MLHFQFVAHEKVTFPLQKNLQYQGHCRIRVQLGQETAQTRNLIDERQN